MAARMPGPISPDELLTRSSLVSDVARSVGFVGRVEYSHVRSQTGGAQFGLGADEGGDALTVYAEAFDRDADPQDFSLLAIIAHERGHQLLVRHPRLAPRLAGVSPAAEEVLASLLGAMVLGEGADRDALIAKATAEVLAGSGPEAAVRLIGELWQQLRGLL